MLVHEVTVCLLGNAIAKSSRFSLGTPFARAFHCRSTSRQSGSQATQKVEKDLSLLRLGGVAWHLGAEVGHAGTIKSGSGERDQAGLGTKSLQDPSATIGPLRTLQPPHLSGAGGIHCTHPSHFFATTMACGTYSAFFRASISSGVSPVVSSQFGDLEQPNIRAAGSVTAEKIASLRKASRRRIGF